MNRPTAANIPALTGFRGFAALIVLLNHAGQFAGLSESTAVRYGYFGVPCFFCLSGVLFAMLYFDEAEVSSRFLGSYYAARFARIFPVYWLVLILFAFSSTPVDWVAIGWHAVMGHGFIAAYRYTLNVPMWTLPVECLFYGLAPWLFVAMRWIRNRAVPQGSANRFHGVHIVSIVGFSLLLIGIGAGFHALAPDDTDWWKGTIFGRFAQFGLGVLTGLFLADVRSGRITVPNSTGNGSVLTAIGLLAVQIWALNTLDTWTTSPAAKWMTFAVKLSFAVTACLLIVGAVNNSIWQRFLASRPMGYHGAISYALYLFQCASFGAVHNLSQTSANNFLRLGLRPWTSAALTMLICIAVAILAHHLFEKPVQRWLRNLRTQPTGSPRLRIS